MLPCRRYVAPPVYAHAASRPTVRRPPPERARQAPLPQLLPGYLDWAAAVTRPVGCRERRPRSPGQLRLARAQQRRLLVLVQPRPLNADPHRLRVSIASRSDVAVMPCFLTLSRGARSIASNGSSYSALHCCNLGEQRRICSPLVRIVVTIVFAVAVAVSAAVVSVLSL